MLIEIDYESSEAIYMQLCNQIVMAIAMSEIQEGDSLPSVRQLADRVGINMHTVNKAYSVLKREGFLQLDRRRGAVISLNVDRAKALEEMRLALEVLLSRARCRGVDRSDVHALVDEVFDSFQERI